MKGDSHSFVLNFYLNLVGHLIYVNCAHHLKINT